MEKDAEASFAEVDEEASATGRVAEPSMGRG